MTEFPVVSTAVMEKLTTPGGRFVLGEKSSRVIALETASTVPWNVNAPGPLFVKPVDAKLLLVKWPWFVLTMVTVTVSSSSSVIITASNGYSGGANGREMGCGMGTMISGAPATEATRTLVPLLTAMPPCPSSTVMVNTVVSDSPRGTRFAVGTKRRLLIANVARGPGPSKL